MPPIDYDDLGDIPADAELWILRSPNGDIVTTPHAACPGTAVVYAFLSRADAETVLDRIPATAPAWRHGAPFPATVEKRTFIEGIALRRENGEAIGYAIISPNETFDFWWPKD